MKDRHQLENIFRVIFPDPKYNPWDSRHADFHVALPMFCNLRLPQSVQLVQELWPLPPWPSFLASSSFFLFALRHKIIQPAQLPLRETEIHDFPDKDQGQNLKKNKENELKGVFLWVQKATSYVHSRLRRVRQNQTHNHHSCLLLRLSIPDTTCLMHNILFNYHHNNSKLINSLLELI